MRTRIAVIEPDEWATEHDLADATAIGRRLAHRGAMLLAGGVAGVVRGVLGLFRNGKFSRRETRL